MQIKFSKYLLLLVIIIISAVKIYYLIKSNQQGVYKESYQISNGDAGHYLRIGKNLNQFQTYSDNFSDTPSESAVWRPPLWPLILSSFYIISDNLLVHILFKNILSILIVLFVLRLIKKTYPSLNVPFWILILILIEPLYLKYSLTFLTEDLGATMLLLVAAFYLCSNKNIVLFPILCVLTILLHPITMFFIVLVFSFYLYRIYKWNKKSLVISALIFIFLFSLWPSRNHYQFKKGFFITSSQGAVLSKAWNDSVYDLYTNVDGDLADETLNLKYIEIQNLPNLSSIDKSNIYIKATINFLKQASTIDILKIGLVKLKSNFNPIPEKSKNTFLDNVSIFFRFLYLILMGQVIYLFIFRKQHLNAFKRSLTEVVLCIIFAQILTSLFFYTGLRFNSIYNLILLLAFILFNFERIRNLFFSMLSKYLNNKHKPGFKPSTTTHLKKPQNGFGKGLKKL